MEKGWACHLVTLHRVTASGDNKQARPQKGQRNCIFEGLWTNARLLVPFRWEIA
ncbi:hypothetical protein AMI01nite_49750 [Aneurinibacillus migulanus]|nr:hypothetical protein AMI01nite_49750 [Aneurinibacillus migulanus]